MKEGVVLRYLKGTIFYANLEPKIGSEQGGIRPVIVVQTDKGNWKNPTVIIAPLTKKINNKPNLPSHINIEISLSMSTKNLVRILIGTDVLILLSPVIRGHYIFLCILDLIWYLSSTF